MAKFNYQGIETHQVIPAQKLLKKVQAEMEVNTLAGWNPDWTKVSCNNHIINLIVAAMLSLPQDRAPNLQRMWTQRKAVSTELTYKTLRLKFDGSSLKKINIYQSKMFVLSGERSAKALMLPIQAIIYLGVVSQTVAGGVGQAFLCSQSCLPTLHFSLAPAPHSWIINLPSSRGQWFFFLLTAHPLKDKHWHKKRQ